MPLDDLTAPGPGQPVQPGWPVRSRALWPRLLVSLVIAGGLFWALRKGGLPMFPPLEAFRRLSVWTVGLFFGLTLVVNLLRVYRWIYLLRPINPRLSARRTLGVGAVGFAAIMFAPLRMGEVVRPWLLAQDREVFFVHAAGTVVAERIVDGLLLTGGLAVGLLLATPLSPLPDHLGNLQLPVRLVPTIATSAFLTFVGAFVAMALFYFWRDLARRLIFAVVGIVSKPFARWVTQQIERLADSLQFLLSRRYGLAFMRDTLAYWALTALSLWFLLRGSGAPASLSQTCVTLGVMGLSTLLPSGPGFFGTYQLGAYCGLAMFFPESVVLGSGAVFTFVSYATQLLTALIFLLVGLWVMGRTPPGPAISQDSGITASGSR